MKKYNYLLKPAIGFILILLTGLLPAQPGGNHNERIELIKTRYLTRQMNLTRDEARLFWPVYDEYQNQLAKITKEREEWSPPSPEAFNKMTDDEINALIDGRLKHAEAAYEARKQLIKDLREILPPRKVAIFLRAEQQFSKELRRRIQERRGMDMPPENE